DFSNLKAYRIPDGTMIPANGYVVFDQTQFGSPANGKNGFGFDAEGDSVWVFSGDSNTNLTGYYHGFKFEGVIEFGLDRFVNSAGEEELVRQAVTTLGTNNAGWLPSPLV